MTTGQQLILAFSALGAFNGIALSLYLFMQKKRPASIYLLGVLVLAISLRVAKSVFYFFNPSLSYIYLQIGLSACFLIGPALYYLFRSIREKPARIPAAWWRDWGILLAVILIGGILVPYQRYPEAWRQYVVRLIYGQWLIYLTATGYLVRHILGTFFRSPSRLPRNEQFLAVLYWSNCLIYAVYLLGFFNLFNGIYIAGGLSFSLVLYISLTFYFYHAPIDSLFDSRQLSASYKPEKKKIADADVRLWTERLETVLSAEMLYKDPNLKLGALARKVNISTHQLSQLLNDNLGKSFSTLINEHRIAEACRLILAGSPLTYEAIGYEVGYNSKSTFYAAFKKTKGVTPSAYKEGIANTCSK